MSKQSDSRKSWEALAKKELGTSPEPIVGPSKVVYQPVYLGEEAEPERTVPGAFPFTRGPRASMYRGRPWTLRQYAGFSTAEESNAFYKQCLARGQRGLSVAFDLPTHRGYDSDHERARGDVGKAGVAIDSVEDMALLFRDIELKNVSVSMTMNGAVLPIMAAYIVVAEEQGAKPSELSGTLQNDILKEFMVRNTFIYPPAPSMKIVSDVIAYCSEHMPRFNPISISGYHMKEAGASEELELAFTLADGVEYVKAAVEGGLDVDSFAPRLSFFFGIGMDLLLEVAKLRAARQLWAELMQERFAPKNVGSMRLRMHCQTSGVSLTAQQPHNNIIRTTIEALAAVLGGTQSLHTNAFDEALALPTEQSARIARNTQLIVQEETDVTRVVDPLGGSYVVEDLTRQLVAKARDIIKQVDELGGMTKAIEQGFPQQCIGRAAAERQVRIDSGEERLVGVNCYALEEESEVEVRVVDHKEVLSTQVSRLVKLKASRDAARVSETLERLKQAAQTGQGNLLALSIGCMRARATVGEVSQAMEEAWGRYVPRGETVTGVFSAVLSSDEGWVMVSKRVLEFEQKHGRRPRILVAKIGQDGHDRGAKVVASGFADAGFDVDIGPLFQSPAEVAQAAVDNDVHVVGISTQAGGHQLLVPELIRELQARGAGHILVVCGGIIPPQDYAALKQAGVSEIFQPGTPIVESAGRVLDALSGAHHPAAEEHG